jgi:hypothetical protein
MFWAWLIAIGLLNPVIGVVSYCCLVWLRGRARAIAWGLIAVLTAMAPVVVPRSFVPLPFLASLAAILSLVKLHDVYRSSSGQIDQGLLAYLVEFANGFWLVRDRPPASPSRAADVASLKRDLCLAAILWVVTTAVFKLDWARHHLMVEHVVKVPLVAMMIAATVNAASAVWRLLGGRALTPMGRFVTAPTPAEFWKNWNRPAQQFFFHYVFIPAGGLRRPARGTFLTFFVSGLVHESVIAVAGAPIHGMQVAFFLIQGLAVIATRRWAVGARWAAVSIAATIAFHLATSTLFFESLNHVLPFYAQR